MPIMYKINCVQSTLYIGMIIEYLVFYNQEAFIALQIYACINKNTILKISAYWKFSKKSVSTEIMCNFKTIR